LDNQNSEFWDIHWGVQNDDAKQNKRTGKKVNKEKTLK
jgi:hypothetical protein